MKKLLTAALLALSMTSFAAHATSPSELRNDRQDIREERRDLNHARHYGDRHDIRDERRDLHDARREYREDLRDRRGYQGRRYATHWERRGHNRVLINGRNGRIIRVVRGYYYR